MKKFYVLLPIIVTLVGCLDLATVPMASTEDDTSAKKFETKPGTGNIYIYRDSFTSYTATIPIVLTGKGVSYSFELRVGSFCLIRNVEPGHYILLAQENTSVGNMGGPHPSFITNNIRGNSLEIIAKDNANCYVAVGTKLFDRSIWDMSVKDEEEGRKGVNACWLIKYRAEPDQAKFSSSFSITQETAVDEESKAKSFKPLDGTANIYVYRDTDQFAAPSPVLLAGADFTTPVMAELVPKSFYKFGGLAPGQYKVVAGKVKPEVGEGYATVDVSEDNNYFIKVGINSASTSWVLTVVEDSIGRQDVTADRLWTIK